MSFGRRHRWDRSRWRPGRQPVCEGCGQGAPSWLEGTLGIPVVDCGIWGSHRPKRLVQTFWCPGVWTGREETYINGKWRRETGGAR